MILMINKKPSIFRKIIIKIGYISEKTKQKYKNSKDFQAIVTLVLDILINGLLLTLGYLSLNTNSILLRIVGFGSLFFIIKEKVVDALSRLLGSFHLVNINR